MLTEVCVEKLASKLLYHVIPAFCVELFKTTCPFVFTLYASVPITVLCLCVACSGYGGTQWLMFCWPGPVLGKGGCGGFPRVTVRHFRDTTHATHALPYYLMVSISLFFLPSFLSLWQIISMNIIVYIVCTCKFI